jgi:hypothetical protein
VLPVGAEETPDSEEHDPGNRNGGARAQHRPVEPPRVAPVAQIDKEPHQAKGNSSNRATDNPFPAGEAGEQLDMAAAHEVEPDTHRRPEVRCAVPRSQLHEPGGVGLVRLSAAWSSRIDERIAELERLKLGLTDCIGCGCLSLDRCQLSNPGDRAAALGPGPRYWIGDRPLNRRVVDRRG